MTSQPLAAKAANAVKDEIPRTASTSSASEASKNEYNPRGRKKERDDEGGKLGQDDGNSDDQKGQGKPERKRKRSRKGLDKKYLCPQEGCGKSYSRAEHLYRHQLNR
jgi:hypothetical protein